MNIDLHCMVKNEAILLEHVLPIWQQYPIRTYIFYNDFSTDNTEQVIKNILGSRAKIITSNRTQWSESANRYDMLQESRDADWIISIDSDELLSANFFKDAGDLFEPKPNIDRRVRCYNLAGSWLYWRRDPKYKHNFLRMTAQPHEVYFDLSLAHYHTQRRLPSNTNNIENIDRVGNIHLQSLNLRFYVWKCLWYKHYEYHVYKRSVQKINAQYDPVVNRLKFEPKPLSATIAGDLYIDPEVFDRLLEVKGYITYVRQNLVPELITFGQELVNIR